MLKSVNSTQPSKLHDPYLYAYMRACGAPRSYWPSYLRQLGLRSTRRLEALSANELVPELGDQRYAWVTSSVRMLSLRYTDKKQPPPLVTATAMADALTAIEAAPDAKGAKKSGLTRAYLHAQARHWAAIVAATPDLADQRTLNDTRARPASELVLEARAARHANTQHRALDRHRNKLRRTQEQQAEARKETYKEARRVYLLARAEFHVARDEHARAQAERRLREGDTAQAPRHLTHALKQAYATYTTCKAKLREMKRSRLQNA